MSARHPGNVWVRLSVLSVAVLLTSAACADDVGSSSSATASSTSSTTSSAPAPVPIGEQAAELQAQAMTRAWSGSGPEGRPICIYGPEVSGELRAAIAAVFPVEVEYFEDLADINLNTGLYRCTIVTPLSVQAIQADVVGVDVWVVRGPVSGYAMTYLFRWDGSQWVDTTPEETGVTVTSAVS